MRVTIPTLWTLQVGDDPRVRGDLGVEVAHHVVQHHLLTTAKVSQDCCRLDIPQFGGRDDVLYNFLLSNSLHGFLKHK